MGAGVANLVRWRRKEKFNVVLLQVRQIAGRGLPCIHRLNVNKMPAQGEVNFLKGYSGHSPTLAKRNERPGQPQN
jgi:hypothetical protein